MAFASASIIADQCAKVSVETDLKMSLLRFRKYLRTLLDCVPLGRNTFMSFFVSPKLGTQEVPNVCGIEFLLCEKKDFFKNLFCIFL